MLISILLILIFLLCIRLLKVIKKREYLKNNNIILTVSLEKEQIALAECKLILEDYKTKLDKINTSFDELENKKDIEHKNISIKSLDNMIPISSIAHFIKKNEDINLPIVHNYIRNVLNDYATTLWKYNFKDCLVNSTLDNIKNHTYFYSNNWIRGNSL